MQAFTIPEHVHFALEEDSVVFMDIRADEYSMLLGKKARAFASLLSRTEDAFQRTIILDDLAADGTPSAALEVITELLENHLLTVHDPTQPAAPPSARIPLPHKHLLDRSMQGCGSLGLRDVWRFVTSCLIAMWMLRFHSMEDIVGTAKRLKRRATARPRVGLLQAARLVRSYNRLRPLFPRDFLCIFNSLSLLIFLAKNECFPDWIFAVRLEPWDAHCWLQYDTIAFDQDIDVAQTYLPLMRV